jgi:hypothetical protein
VERGKSLLSPAEEVYEKRDGGFQIDSFKQITTMTDTTCIKKDKVKTDDLAYIAH